MSWLSITMRVISSSSDSGNSSSSVRCVAQLRNPDDRHQLDHERFPPRDHLGREPKEGRERARNEDQRTIAFAAHRIARRRAHTHERHIRMHATHPGNFSITKCFTSMNPGIFSSMTAWWNAYSSAAIVVLRTISTILSSASASLEVFLVALE